MQMHAIEIVVDLSELNQLTRLFKQESRMGGQVAEAAETEADAICDLLTIHTELEEEIVYPAIRTVDARMADSACAYGRRNGVDRGIQRIS